MGSLEMLAPAGSLLASLTNILASLEFLLTESLTHPHASSLKYLGLILTKDTKKYLINIKAPGKYYISTLGVWGRLSKSSTLCMCKESGMQGVYRMECVDCCVSKDMRHNPKTEYSDRYPLPSRGLMAAWSYQWYVFPKIGWQQWSPFLAVNWQFPRLGWP